MRVPLEYIYIYIYVVFKAPDSTLYKSLNFDGEPLLPVQYKRCSVNYQETKEEKKSLKEANQK